LFESLVTQARTEHPDLDSMLPRQKALTVVKFLRSNNLTGIASELQFRDLRNNYIGIAIQDPEHCSLPLISVAIFCAIAQRLGINAHACAFPNHVHAIVSPTTDESHDHHSSSQTTDVSNNMYLDPYRSEFEVPVEHLKTQLTAWGVGIADLGRFLGNSSTRAMCLRTLRNILATVQEFRGVGHGRGNNGHPSIRLHANPFADMDNAFYSALWANFMLSDISNVVESAERLQILPMILERFERLYPMDASLIERYVIPPFSNISAGNHYELFETLRVVRAGDSMPKQIRTRDSIAPVDRVKYRVGEVFQHRRYGYTAVIIGWDIECSMNSQWMAQNRVDTLDKGRHQSFYHAL
jgi:F-box protein 21